MKEAKDALGTPLQVGDYITYATRGSTDMTMHVAIITEVIERKSKYNPIAVKVKSVFTDGTWRYTHYRNGAWTAPVIKAHKAKLTSNDALIKISSDVIPAKLLEALDACK